MDVINRTILSELKKNARISWGQLASVAGVSRQSLRKRIARLEEKGDIAGYTIVTPLQILSKTEHEEGTVRAFLRIRFGKGNNCFKLAKFLSANRDIAASWAVAGDWDNVVLAEAGSMEKISEIREMIVRTGGIEEIETEVVMNELFRRSRGFSDFTPQ